MKLYGMLDLAQDEGHCYVTESQRLYKTML